MLFSIIKLLFTVCKLCFAVSKLNFRIVKLLFGIAELLLVIVYFLVRIGFLFIKLFLTVIDLALCLFGYLVISALFPAVRYLLNAFTELIARIFIFIAVAVVLLKLVGGYHNLSVDLGLEAALRHIANHKDRTVSDSRVAALGIRYIHRRLKPADYRKLLDRKRFVYIGIFISAKRQLVTDLIILYQLAVVDKAFILSLRQSALGYIQRTVWIIFSYRVNRIYPCHLFLTRVGIDISVRVISGINIHIGKPVLKRLYIIFIKAVCRNQSVVKQ